MLFRSILESCISQSKFHLGVRCSGELIHFGKFRALTANTVRRFQRHGCNAAFCSRLRKEHNGNAGCGWKLFLLPTHSAGLSHRAYSIEPASPSSLKYLCYLLERSNQLDNVRQNVHRELFRFENKRTRVSSLKHFEYCF